MSMLRNAALAAFVILNPVSAGAEGPALGQPLEEDEIPALARAVLPDGAGLPPGGGTASQGRPVYAEQCGYCHGETGLEGPIMPLVGPNESYAKPAGAYWPYATTLFDYIRRAMPFHAPKSLTDDETYALTAYILWRNAVISQEEVMDATSLPAVSMPNREMFRDLWDRQGSEPYEGEETLTNSHE